MFQGELEAVKGVTSEEKSERQAGASSLDRRVAKGAAWIVAARILMRALGFINTLILARLLAPQDFGLVAIGVTIMQLLQNVSDIGVAQTVVKFRDADRKDLDTLFTLSALRGVAVMLILLGLAPLAASFYNDPRVFYVFVGVSLAPLFTGLINPKFYEFERNLDFSREFFAVGVSKFAGVAISVAIALVYQTYWAIIFGLVAGALAQTIISYALQPYFPRFSLASIRKLIGFAGWLTGVSFVAALNNKLDTLILARTLGAGPAGNFYVGAQLADMPSGELAYPIARAIYPGLSELQADQTKMREAFLRGVQALGIFAMPAAFGLAFVAPDLVPLILGEKWSDAIPVIQILAPALGLQALFVATQAYAMALGETRLVFFRELAHFIIRTPLFIWASLAFGLVGASIATSAANIVHVGLNLLLYRRVSGRPALEPLGRASRPLVGILAMTFYFAVVSDAVTPSGEAFRALRLVIDIALGAGVYLTTVFALWRAHGRPPGIETDLIAIARARFASS